MMGNSMQKWIDLSQSVGLVMLWITVTVKR